MQGPGSKAAGPRIASTKVSLNATSPGQKLREIMAELSLVAHAPAPPVSPLLVWGEQKHMVMLKEGLHIILKHIVARDHAYLGAACPLWGRLSRAEQRSSALRFAGALASEEPIARDVISDTVCLAVLAACEAKAIEEAADIPRIAAGAVELGTVDIPRGPRIPPLSLETGVESASRASSGYMQKVRASTRDGPAR